MLITIRVKTNESEVELSNHDGRKVISVDGEEAGKICELIEQANDVIMNGLKED